MGLLEHAKRELKLAGYDISDKGCDMHDDKEPFTGYLNYCARNAYELIETLYKAEHSGMSIGITLEIFNKLAKWETLTPLTNNPDEWCKLEGCEDGDWQSKRNPSCFTRDFKTYWNVDEPENQIRTGEHTFKMKPKSEWIKHPLKDYKK